MTFFIQNVRGLNKALRHREVEKLLLKHKVEILGLVETKIKLPKVIYIVRRLTTHWNVVINASICSKK